MRLLPQLNNSQIEYNKFAKESAQGQCWSNLEIEINTCFNQQEQSSKCQICFDYNKKSPTVYCCFTEKGEYYKVTSNEILFVDVFNCELTRFQKRLSIQQTYSVMKNYVIGQFNFLPYYFQKLPHCLCGHSQKLNIQKTIDTILNEIPKIEFIGHTDKVYIQDKKSGRFTQPLQYECHTWVDVNTKQIDSVIIFNNTNNDFQERKLYRITRIDHNNKINYFDSIFDFNSKNYNSYSIRNGNSLPNSTPNIDKNNLEQCFGFDLININNDTTNLNKKEGWIILDIWQFGCRGCYLGFEKMQQEKDSIGIRFLEKENIQIVAVNALSNNNELIKKISNKFENEDIVYGGKGILDYLSLVNISFPSYYLISPDKEIVWRSNYLGDYSELLKAKSEYEKQHQKE